MFNVVNYQGHHLRCEVHVDEGHSRELHCHKVKLATYHCEIGYIVINGYRINKVTGMCRKSWRYIDKKSKVNVKVIVYSTLDWII